MWFLCGFKMKPSNMDKNCLLTQKFPNFSIILFGCYIFEFYLNAFLDKCVNMIMTMADRNLPSSSLTLVMYSALLQDDLVNSPASSTDVLWAEVYVFLFRPKEAFEIPDECLQRQCTEACCNKRPSTICEDLVKIIPSLTGLNVTPMSP